MSVSLDFGGKNGQATIVNPFYKINLKGYFNQVLLYNKQPKKVIRLL